MEYNTGLPEIHRGSVSDFIKLPAPWWCLDLVKKDEVDMGYRYKNNLDDDAERKYLESLSPLKRTLYKLCYRIWMLIAILFAFYFVIGWCLVKLF